MNLKDQIASLASRFANDVVAAITAAVAERLDGEASPPRGPRGQRSRRGTERNARGRTREQVAAIGEKILGALRKVKDGLRAEELRAKVGLARAEIQRPIAQLLAEGRLRKTGEKRSTVYFAGDAPSGAKEEGTATRRAAKQARRAGAKSRKAGASETKAAPARRPGATAKAKKPHGSKKRPSKAGRAGAATAPAAPAADAKNVTAEAAPAAPAAEASKAKTAAPRKATAKKPPAKTG
jgi:hypothetical protein